MRFPPIPLFRRASRRLLVGSLALLLSTQPVFAQVPSAATDSSERSGPRFEEAKRHFEAGLKLASSDWEAALRQFMRSLEIFPTRAAARNAGIALRQLGRYAEAYDMYDKLQQQFGAKMPAEEAAQVAREKEELRALVGELHLNVRQLGADIVLDGVERGKAPSAQALRLNPGRYTLEVNLTGFERYTATIVIQAGQSTQVSIDLRPSPLAGSLEVREARGQSFDVLVDSVLAGKTPWRGHVLAGAHTVALTDGKGNGTAPQAVQVKARGSAKLTLRAVKLDAELEVRTTPIEANIAIDGVVVGTGLWRGALPSGAHDIAITLEGYEAKRARVAIIPHHRLPIEVRLNRETHVAPRERDIMRSLLVGSYVEAYGGPLFARSLRGGAEARCGCESRSRPWGAAVGVRLGHELRPRLALELGAGFLSLSETVRRNVVSTSPDPYASLASRDFEDSVRLRGPALQASGQFRSQGAAFVTARIGVGAARLTSKSAGTGSFSGTLTNPNDPAERREYNVHVDFREDETRFWAAMFSTELKAGYRFHQRVSVDIGVALLAILPETRQRTLGGAQRFARLRPPEQPWSDGEAIRPGHAELPNEALARVFLAIAPSLGLRVDF